MTTRTKSILAKTGVIATFITMAVLLTGFDAVVDLKNRVLVNTTAYIPPQCYVVTDDGSQPVKNGCYPCHTEPTAPNRTFDEDLQLEYAFPAEAETNRWTNLLKDRTAKADRIGDDEIRRYISVSNYFDPNGAITVADRLKNVPRSWDYDNDGEWSGYVPDCYFNFDDEGFDRDRSGGLTGWRAYGYYPFPATHWPTNGGTSDVMIRLPEAFRLTASDRSDIDVYKLNLAILESIIKRADVAIEPTNERRYGVDLDKDGSLATAERITYEWAPLDGKNMRFVGAAGRMQDDGHIRLAAGLYPAGTEFLQTIRYIDVKNGVPTLSARLKEVRYARKRRWYTYSELETFALNEVKERADFPDRLKLPVGNVEDGISNGRGWVMQGFIENADGDLRPQSVEESTYCIGCHGGVGATTDSTYSFRRKLDSREHQRGWFHWSQKDLRGLNEPKIELKNVGIHYEYSFYLMYAGAADEYHANPEAEARFFDEEGRLRLEMAERLHEDISLLLYPSAARATALNKVYKTIVDEQSYTLGREPVLGTANLHDEIEAKDLETGVTEAVVSVTPPRDFDSKYGTSSAEASPSPRLVSAVDGDGMSGPDGRRYQIDWSGLIDESTYGVDNESVYFPFPTRHTLPTRIIVPNSNMSSCYTCHRLETPMPNDDPQITVPVPIPATSMQETGLSLTQLTKDAGTDVNAQWSPDGRRIAWESDRSGTFQVWVMNADGSNKVQVTSEPAKHGWPRWSPNSTDLVVWGFEEATGVSTISTVNADGSAFRTIVESDGALDRPEYRPDGRYIAYAAETDGNWDVWVTDVRGRRFYQLTHDAQMETNPLWHPNGNIIAYKVAPNKAYNLTIENFIDVHDGFERPSYRIWDGTKSIQMNDWSPDGSYIVYTAEAVTNASGEDRVSYLAVVDDVHFDGAKTSGSPVVLSGATLGDRGPVFSPDGRRVAFWAWDTDYRATLWTANVDGSDLRQLTKDGFDMYPRYSPSGRVLAFESGRSGNMDIWVVGVR